MSKAGNTALAFMKASGLPAPIFVSRSQGLAELCVSFFNIKLHPAPRYHLERPEGSSHEDGRVLGEIVWASSLSLIHI